MDGFPRAAPRSMSARGISVKRGLRLNRTAWAGVGRQLWIAHIENKSGLPCGICGDFGEQRGARGRFASNARSAVHHLHGLVRGARGKSTGNGEEMRALPDSACLQALFLGHNGRARL